VTPQTPGKGPPLHKRIFYLGVAVLVAGLIGAALIYVSSANTRSDDLTAQIADQRAYEYQIERFGGMATVYLVRFNEWLSSLWHGRQLAVTVGVLAIMIALVCFWVAGLLSASLPEGRDEGRKS
jgi:uncharacterized membrane protein (DUF485 family)